MQMAISQKKKKGHLCHIGVTNVSLALATT